MFGGLLRSRYAPHTGGPVGVSSFLPTASEEVMPPLPVWDMVSSGACSCEALKARALNYLNPLMTPDDPLMTLDDP